MDFKFISQELWSKKQNNLFQRMLEKEFWILTSKCGNNLKHENEAEGPWPVYWSIGQSFSIELNILVVDWSNVIQTNQSKSL